MDAVPGRGLGKRIVWHRGSFESDRIITNHREQKGWHGSACKQIHFFILCPLYLGKPFQNVPCLPDMHLMGTGDIMLAGNRELIVVFFDFENPSFVALGSLVQMRFHIL